MEKNDAWLIRFFMAKTKETYRRSKSGGYDMIDQIAIKHTELCECYSRDVDMPIHGSAQFFTKLYSLDKDQVSLYPSWNRVNDDGEGECNESKARYSIGKDIQNGNKGIEEEDEQQPTHERQGKAIVLYGALKLHRARKTILRRKTPVTSRHRTCRSFDYRG